MTKRRSLASGLGRDLGATREANLAAYASIETLDDRFGERREIAEHGRHWATFDGAGFGGEDGKRFRVIVHQKPNPIGFTAKLPGSNRIR